jgi:hypothetical protein
MKRIVYILTSLTMLLSGCGTLEISFDVTPASAAGGGITATPEPFDQTPWPDRQGGQDRPAPVTLSMDSTSTEIQEAMLKRASRRRSTTSRSGSIKRPAASAFCWDR